MAGFMDWVTGALGGRDAAQQQAEEAGLPPLTLKDYARRNGSIADQGGAMVNGEWQPVLKGMEAFPFGPGGGRIPGVAPRINNPIVPYARPGAPAVPGGLTTTRPPLSGTVSGAQPVPQGTRPGVGRGQTYEGQFGYRDQIVPYGRPGGPSGGGGATLPPGTASPPGGTAGGMPPRIGPPGSVAGRPRRVNQTGQPGPDSGPIPMGGQVQGTSPAQRLSEPGFFEKMWKGATAGQKAGGLGGAAGAAGILGDMLGNIFGGDEVGAGQERPKIPWPDQRGSGGGGGSAFQMPKSYREELQKMIPSVDYENLPRPDFARVHQAMQSLAPEAPEDRNFLDKLPANMKNILGFGILLGPVGLLLGAGMGMAENQSIDKAEREQFMQESRDHLREVLGFEIDYGKAMRAMAKEEQEGARNQAIEMLNLDLGLQNHELGLRQAQDEMATNAARRAQIARAGGDSQFDIDKLFQRAMMLDPMGTMGMWEQLRSAEDAPMGLSGDQADTYNQMLKAAVVRALYE